MICDEAGKAGRNGPTVYGFSDGKRRGTVGTGGTANAN